MKRHITIAVLAGLFSLIAIPFAARATSSPYFNFIVAGISAFIWFFMSVIVLKPSLKDWMICGVVSPYIGFPLAFALAQDKPFNSLLILGIQIAIFGAWLLIPGGLLMGLIAHRVSVAFEPKKHSKR